MEYLLLAALVALPLALTLALLGAETVQSWAYSREVLYGQAP